MDDPILQSLAIVEKIEALEALNVMCVDYTCAGVNQVSYCLGERVAISQLVAYCLQLPVSGERSKEEGSLLLDEESMSYERVDEPGFASLSVHSIPYLASLFSDEGVVIQGEGGSLVHAHDPVPYLLGRQDRVVGVHRREWIVAVGWLAWWVVRRACTPRCMGRGWKPLSLSGGKGRC